MNINPDRTSTHETWLMASWLFADEKAFNMWTDIAVHLVPAVYSTDIPPIQFLASKLEHHYERKLDEQIKGPGLMYDLTSNAFSHIQWEEVAQLLIENCNISDDA